MFLYDDEEGKHKNKGNLQDAVAIAGIAEVLETKVALAFGKLLAEGLLQLRPRGAHHHPPFVLTAQQQSKRRNPNPVAFPLSLPQPSVPRFRPHRWRGSID